MAENVTEIRAVIRSELILASHSRGIIEFILRMLDFLFLIFLKKVKSIINRRPL